MYRRGAQFIVKTPTNKITGLEVYDVSGKLIHHLYPNSTEAVIDSDSLTNGMYILKIYRNGEVINRKIIK